MLLGQGSFSARIAQWLALNTDEQSAFEIADANFVTGSDEPTVEGRRQVSQIAQVLKADHQLRAQVIVTNGSSDEDSALQLARARALRIGKELLAQRAPAENLSVLAQPLSEVQAKHIFEDPGQRSELFVVLSR
jgi:outer membrane protein OmpA-like peptidoglycan-associated protein